MTGVVNAPAQTGVSQSGLDQFASTAASGPVSLAPLPRILLEPLVRATLLEDLGRAGDITSDAIVPAGAQATLALNARDHGILAGIDLAVLAFQLIDPSIHLDVALRDGARLAPGDVIANITGPARGMLTAERTALNFLGHLSGVASVTNAIVRSVAGHRAQIVCTRKTTPGLRAVEKYAVRAGGGGNHRFGLDDAVLIKDNHIAIAGGVGEAIRRVRANVGHMVKLEVEVDTLTQLHQALEHRVDAVLLDNMTPDQLQEAVTLIAGRAISEASGRVTAQTAPAIAASGVDLISIGWLTHSAPVLDMGLDWVA